MYILHYLVLMTVSCSDTMQKFENRPLGRATFLVCFQLVPKQPLIRFRTLGFGGKSIVPFARFIQLGLG